VPHLSPWFASLFLLPLMGQPPSEAFPMARALRLHTSLFTVDTHVDTPGRLASGFDLAQRHTPGTKGAGCLDFPRMQEGGLSSAFFAVFVNQGPCTPIGRARAKAKALEQLDQIDRVFVDQATLCGRALSPTEGQRIAATGRRAIFLGLENGYALGLDLDLVDAFHARGIRYITLAHTSDNDLCDSSTGKREGPERGLTAFGAKVVRRMNELGMLVDISHLSDRSVRDVLKLTKAPIIASHSCARAVCDHPRNLSDELLKALKTNGGVIQLCILGDYIKKLPANPEQGRALQELQAKVEQHYGGWDNIPDAATATALEEEYQAIFEKHPGGLPTVRDAVDHIDHIVQLVGIDHVGIGTDFDGGGGLADCRDVTQLPRITAELLRRGYSETSIRKIWGGNFLRAFEEALKTAAQITR
jgi:membrane dipeptidase